VHATLRHNLVDVKNNLILLKVMPLKSASPIAGGASGWHSDVTWRKTPSLGSILYCEVAPAFGGSTGATLSTPLCYLHHSGKLELC
jgi:hypothetical protein